MPYKKIKRICRGCQKESMVNPPDINRTCAKCMGKAKITSNGNRNIHERSCKGCGEKRLVAKCKLNQQCTNCYHKSHKKHGMATTKIYRIWMSMLRRCNNRKCQSYKDYGQRGIQVCKSWLEFENFYRDVGDKPKNKSLDRIDNNGNYCPENIRWATQKIQANNTRRNVHISAFGKTKNITQWAEEFGLTHKVISKRLKLGWPIEKSLTEPVNKRRKS